LFHSVNVTLQGKVLQVATGLLVTTVFGVIVQRIKNATHRAGLSMVIGVGAVASHHLFIVNVTHQEKVLQAIIALHVVMV